MRNTWSVVGIIAAFLVVVVVLWLVGMAFGYVTLPFYKFGRKVDYTQKTIDMVYDAQMCAAINAQFLNLRARVPAVRNVQIPNAQEALDSYEKKLPADQTKWSVQQQQLDSERQTDLAGQKQQLVNLEVEYTALTQREDAIPCLGHLPTFIDLK